MRAAWLDSVSIASSLTVVENTGVLEDQQFAQADIGNGLSQACFPGSSFSRRGSAFSLLLEDNCFHSVVLVYTNFLSLASPASVSQASSTKHHGQLWSLLKPCPSCYGWGQHEISRRSNRNQPRKAYILSASLPPASPPLLGHQGALHGTCVNWIATGRLLHGTGAQLSAL